MATRTDGRKDNELRPISVEFYTNSVKYSQGFSQVEVNVLRPKVSSSSSSSSTNISNKNLRSLSLEVSIHPRSGPITDEERLLEVHLVKSLQTCLYGRAYPNCYLRVIIQVLDIDGSMASVCFNATVLALLNAGIGMYLTPCAFSIGLIKTENTYLKRQTDTSTSVNPHEQENLFSTICLDPTQEEITKFCDSVLCLCFDTQNGVVMSNFAESGSGVYAYPSYLFEVGKLVSKEVGHILRNKWEDHTQQIQQLFKVNNFFDTA